MRASKRRGIVVLVMMFGALALSAQTAPLNPTVKVLIEPAGSVPPGCVDGDVPEVAQKPPSAVPPRPQPVPLPPEPVAPQPAASSGDVRSNLRDAHAAATRRDRASFDAAVAAAKGMSSSASAADRTMAAGVLDVYDDIARLWDYQFNTPAGSFFDESVQGGSLLGSLKSYPGYESFIDPNTIRDANGTRYYPTRESMDFLVRVAGERLTRGGAAPTRVAETPRVEVPAPAKAPTRTSTPVPSPVPMPVPPPVVADGKPPTTPRQEVVKPTPKRSTTTRTTPARRRARSTTPAVVDESEPAVAKRTASKSASTSSPAAASSSPVTTSPVIEDPLVPQGVVSEPSPAETGTTMTEPVPMPTDTMATDTTVTEPAVDTVVPQEAAQPGKKRSIILPLVLILIGVGVLIILFRASS